MRPGKFIIMTIATVAGVSLVARKTKVNIPGFH